MLKEHVSLSFVFQIGTVNDFEIVGMAFKNSVAFMFIYV